MTVGTETFLDVAAGTYTVTEDDPTTGVRPGRSGLRG